MGWICVKTNKKHIGSVGYANLCVNFFFLQLGRIGK